MESFLTNEIVQIVAHIAGIVGMVSVLIAYFGIEKGWFNRSDSRYYIVNLTGAGLLTLSLIVHFNLGSLLLQLFWIGISISGLMRIKKENRD